MYYSNKSYLVLLIIGVFSIFSNVVYSQEETEYYPFLNKSFLIISSTKDYKSAEKVAQQATVKLKLEYPESLYTPDKKEGFKELEACSCGETHGYFPRGSHDDGNYVSIEFSTAYEGFSEGYYIVIVSSGTNDIVEKELPKVKESFPQAYIKNSEIYVGCLH